MSTNLAAFLSDRSPAAVESTAWGDAIRLEATGYLSNEIPPLPKSLSGKRTFIVRAA